MDEKEKVYWLAGSEQDKAYDSVIWYRCLKGQEFTDKIEETDKIVGIAFHDNNIGFIVDKKG